MRGRGGYMSSRPVESLRQPPAGAPGGAVVSGIVVSEEKAIALLNAEVDHDPDPPAFTCAAEEADLLRDENDRLRDLLAKALPWIDPNDSHEDYLLTVEIREALGEGS